LKSLLKDNQNTEIASEIEPDKAISDAGRPLFLRTIKVQAEETEEWNRGKFSLANRKRRHQGAAKKGKRRRKRLPARGFRRKRGRGEELALGAEKNTFKEEKKVGFRGGVMS